MRLFYFFFLSPLLIFSQIPVYYQTVDFSKTGNDLKNELHQLMISTHHTYLPYTQSGSTDTWTVIKQSDLVEDNSDNVLLIYGYNDNDGNYQTDRTRSKTLSCHTSSCTGLWTREHVYPRSIGTPDLGFELAGTDLFNLHAIDAWRNNSRSNKMFGDAPNSQASYSLDTTSYYPGEEWRGDIARIIMYMYMRYTTQCIPNAVGTGATTFSSDMPDVFLKWNVEDPVSDHEIRRNNVIYSYQGNRNPFIDNPYLATIIWNGQPATDSWNILSNQISTIEDLNVFPTMTSDVVYITSNQNEKYNIYVYNTLGQKIQSVEQQNQINLSQNTSGIYFLKIENEYSNKTFKVILK